MTVKVWIHNQVVRDMIISFEQDDDLYTNGYKGPSALMNLRGKFTFPNILLICSILPCFHP